uniref:tetraspanin-8-like n=1 Tax=Solea senegalensis TaxID=28829 RepID=UPI001CD8A34D|nr:tetraspanin-8-like [Solea senegalensis]
MGKVHICLKRSFIGVINVIAILNAIMFGDLIANGHLPDGEEIQNKPQLLVFTITPLVLVILGVFGVYKKKKWALIVFTVGMILIDAIMLLLSAVFLAGKTQLVEEFGNKYRDVGPLSESQEFQLNLSEQQKKFQCCGLARGYMDWGHDIPDTCECIGSATSNPCVELYTSDDSVRMVYEKPCLPYLMENYEWFITVVGGIAMAFSLLWMLSVVLSIVILCKLCQKEDAPAVVYHTGEN